MKQLLRKKKGSFLLGVAGVLTVAGIAGAGSVNAWAVPSRGVAASDNIMVREEAVNGGQVGSLTENQEVKITGEKTASDGKVWYSVVIQVNGEDVNGWVRSDLINTDVRPAGNTDEEDMPEDGEIPAAEGVIRFDMKNGYVDLTDVPEDVAAQVSDRFVERECEMESGTILAYQLASPDELVSDDAVLTQFYYVYGSNEIGETGWYLYDAQEKSLQKSLTNMSYSLSVEEEPQEEATQFQADSLQRMILGALGVVSLLLMILAIVFSVRYRRLRNVLEAEVESEEEKRARINEEKRAKIAAEKRTKAADERRTKMAEERRAMTAERMAREKAEKKNREKAADAVSGSNVPVDRKRKKIEAARRTEEPVSRERGENVRQEREFGEGSRRAKEAEKWEKERAEIARQARERAEETRRAEELEQRERELAEVRRAQEVAMMQRESEEEEARLERKRAEAAKKAEEEARLKRERAEAIRQVERTEDDELPLPDLVMPEELLGMQNKVGDQMPKQTVAADIQKESDSSSQEEDDFDDLLDMFLDADPEDEFKEDIENNLLSAEESQPDFNIPELDDYDFEVSDDADYDINDELEADESADLPVSGKLTDENVEDDDLEFL